MDARLIQKLLRCVQSPDDRVAMSAALEAFCAEHPTVGYRQGRFYCMRPADKETIAQLLRAEGIAPDTAHDAWKGSTRADALALGNDEKLALQPVKRRRIAVKPLRPGMPIDVGTGAMTLPPKCHVDVDYDQVTPVGHDWLIVVENWEAFDEIHLAAERLPFPGVAPLVVWRGDASGTRADAMLAWISTLRQPVAAFVDYDPAGLVIAAGLPRLATIVAPSLPLLQELVRTRGLHDRFQEQLPSCQQALDATTHREVRSLWAMCRVEGKALPQEIYLR
jgi:hypothetical protein